MEYLVYNSGCASTTQLMYKANCAHGQLWEYLAEMQQLGMLVVVSKEKRNLYEVLYDFNSFDYFPIELLLETLEILRYREYSISSSFLKN